MNYGVGELSRVNPPTLGMGIGSVDFHNKFGPEPDPLLFQNYLNNPNAIKIDTRTLQIPEPSLNWKQQPGYTPTQLPGDVDNFILRGYFGVT